nr:glycosyltransferase [uncultured Massilia sp.]
MRRHALLRWAGAIADEADERESKRPFHIRQPGLWRSCIRCLAIFLSSPLRMPVAIMEAMALRRPVLSTYVAGIPELVSTGVNGWLVPSGSAEALAAAMESCLSASPADIEKMGKAAQRIALERHDIACETRKLAGHFLQVVGERTHALGR